MHNENTYCHMSDACKLLKEKEQLVLQFKAANEKKNEFLKKIGIYATGEFHRIDYYIDKLVAENDKLKRYKDSKQASYETMQIEWNEAKNEVKQLKEELENFKDDCKGCTTCIKAQNNERIYSQSSRKYKQALQEIKDYCNKYSQNSIGFKQQILQKCEVIDE